MNISVAMATYNGSTYIVDQLRSLLSQTRPPDELIIIDDCSSDETLDAIASFSSTIKMVVMRNSTNIGHYKSFEKALSVAQGQIIFLCDQDDFWLPTKIETIEKYFNENPSAYVVAHDAFLSDAQLNRMPETLMTEMSRSGKLGPTNRDYVLGCATALRREFLNLALPFPKYPYGHDRWIHLIAYFTQSKHLLSTPLIVHRRHQHNASQLNISQFQFNTPQLETLEVDARFVEIYCQRALLCVEISERIIENSDLFSSTSFKYDDMVYRSLSSASNFLARASLMTRRGVMRKLLIIKLLLTGGYSDFNGLRSFAKDLIR